MWIRAFCNTLEGERTKKIPILPEKVTLEHIEEKISSDCSKVPIGMNANTLEIATFDFSNFIHMIYRENSNT